MSFAIQSKDGLHLGFLLFSGGPAEGDCIFRSLPSESEGFDLPESNCLFALQEHGEFRWASVGDGSFRVKDASAQTVAEIIGGQMNASNYRFLVVPLNLED